MEIIKAIQNLREAAYLLDTLKSRMDMIASTIELIEGATCRFGIFDANFATEEVCIDVSLAGDRRKLAEFWRTMRGLGYTPSARPVREETSYYATWRSQSTAFAKIRVWIYFTSTQCVRMKVGQKLVDVFETRCL